MGESSPPTAVDYASDNASSALQQTRSLERRVAHLEHHLRAALVAIDELRAAQAKAAKCCSSYPNGPQWGHEWSCPKCPD